MKREPALIAWVLLLGVCGAGERAFAQKQPAAAEPSSVSWKAPVQSQAGDYAGIETCSACHSSEAEQFRKTAHARTDVATTGPSAGCESCHGPGKAHADAMLEAGGDAAKIRAAKNLIFAFRGKPQQNAARCLACHSTSKDQHLFNRSEHKLQGISCNQCHSAHLVMAAGKAGAVEPSSAQGRFFLNPKLAEESRWLRQSLLRKPQPDLCFNCHKTIQAQFALPAHHRVSEGLMSCTDCHNTHGTLNRPLLKKANWEACITCHIEKRGPFVFEHAALKVEGCTACHSPHGTQNRNMLLRAEGRFLCLQCHVNPFAANVPHGRFGFPTRGECVRCHATIHGSNFSEFFLR